MPGWEAAADALETWALPVDGEGLWGMFLALHVGRPKGEMGPGPIPYTEIDAFQRLHGLTLHPWEVRAVKAMDLAFLDYVVWRTSDNETEREKVAKRYQPPVVDVPAPRALLTGSAPPQRVLPPPAPAAAADAHPDSAA